MFEVVIQEYSGDGGQKLCPLTSALHINSHIAGNIGIESEDASNILLAPLQTKIAESWTIDQVIDAVFADYHPELKALLLTSASWCEKMEAAQSSKERLASAPQSQTIPPCLRVKVPKFQFTKEFGDSNSAVATAAKNAFTIMMQSFQAAINMASLAGKVAEFDFWAEKCCLTNLYDGLLPLISQTWEALKISVNIY